MAAFAFRVNETTENIGARRLHTIMERVLEEISFLAPDLARAAANAAQAEGAAADGTKMDAAQADAMAAMVKAETTVPLPYVERETGTGVERVFVVSDVYVKQMVAEIVKSQDLSRYIL